MQQQGSVPQSPLALCEIKLLPPVSDTRGEADILDTRLITTMEEGECQASPSTVGQEKVEGGS